ncbi:hypothetical protein CHS0354_011901 [Potamilus streckersoni]|uniref:Uncharacterized protein n=1 Tax=Potamilus streckersoni TaxID=2493646 RepID=A0AAE0W420_9BIVA|nr:hypothetical protein CHS0354_011901 [Potamilus streckersoni]
MSNSAIGNTCSIRVDEEHKIKLTMIGDSSVGKTCLALRFSQDLFTTDHKATITDIETRVLNIEGQDVLFQIWDTAGQERFRSLLPLYLRGIDGAVLVYDLTNPESFMNITTWINEVRKYASGNPVMALVGNKTDLNNYIFVAREDGEKLASEQGMIFMETSAKTGHNVQQAFFEVGKEVLKRKNNGPGPAEFADCVKVDDNDDSKKRRGCCS